MVKSSSLAGLATGLSWRELTLGVLPCAMGCPILDFGRAGLTFGLLLCVCDRGRAVVFVVVGFFVAVGAGAFSGVMSGVDFPGRRTAYGSAVTGLFNSGRGRIGRRTVPDISEPVPVEFFNADFVDSPDMAEGGRAGPDDAVDRFEAVLAPNVLLDCDLAGV